MELFVVVILLIVTAAQGSQLEGPQNAVSIVGSNVTLRCLTPSRNCNGIDWIKYSHGSPSTVFRDHGGISTGYRGRYSVDNNSPGCGLIIENVQLTDAGRFICRAIIASKTVEKSAHLIILETQPNCTTNASMNDTVEEDRVQLNCVVTYNEASRVSMVWKETQPRYKPTITASQNETAEDDSTYNEANRASMVLKGVTDTPVFEKNGETIILSYFVVASAPEVPSFTCITSFAVETKGNIGEPIIGLATNIPNITCETSAIKVLHYKGRPKATAMISVAVSVAVVFLLLIVLLIICFCVRVCPGYKCCHSGNNSQDLTKARMNGCPLLRNQMREEQPLPENPDTCIYSVVNKQQNAHLKAKPSLASTSESPNLPQGATLQARPRTDNSQSGHTNAYQHEEVTYADLAMEFGPRKVVPNYNPVPEETLYAAVGTA